MNETMAAADLNQALAGLMEKYAVEPREPWRILTATPADDPASDSVTLVPGQLLADTELPSHTVPLAAWRHQRRFRELKGLLNNETITPLLMCRFACLSDGRRLPLRSILYREFDLLQWISGTPIVALCATMASKRTANVIVRLGDGPIASVEAGATLPPGTALQDRHELIARRGVASDRVVDTQIGQSSIYTWTAKGTHEYTDVDAELFGLDVEQVALVRSAFDVLRRPTLVAQRQIEHQRLQMLVELAYESSRRRKRLAVERA